MHNFIRKILSVYLFCMALIKNNCQRYFAKVSNEQKFGIMQPNCILFPGRTCSPTCEGISRKRLPRIPHTTQHVKNLVAMNSKHCEALSKRNQPKCSENGLPGWCFFRLDASRSVYDIIFAQVNYGSLKSRGRRYPIELNKIALPLYLRAT